MPETLLGWDVIGWIIGFLIPGGVGVLALNEYRAAKTCFGISALILFAKTLLWGVHTKMSFGPRTLLSVAAFGLLGFCLVESFRWVDRKRATVPQIPAAAPPPAATPLVAPSPSPLQPALETKTVSARGLKFPGFRENVKNVSLSIGGNSVSIPLDGLRNKTFKGSAFVFNGVAVTPYLEGDHLYVDLSVYRGPGLAAIEVKKGVVSVDVPGWDRNSNESAFEVVNENGVPVFQMVYLTPSDIAVRGILVFGSGYVLVANETSAVMNPKNVFMFAPKPLFKYPSRLHRGEAAQ